MWFSSLIRTFDFFVCENKKMLMNLNQRISAEDNYFTEVEVLCDRTSTNLIYYAFKGLYKLS